jgi:uncharacterized protein
MMGLEEKLDRLKSMLEALGSGLVAYSGGVDSTFLLKVAKDVLGDRVIAATADSEVFHPKELEASRNMARRLGVKQIITRTDQLVNPDFAANTPERCYHCKRQILSRLIEIAEEHGKHHVMDAATLDDTGDFRPGMRAASELGVRSPLKDVGLTKGEIRALSKAMNLPTWDKPSSPCLATRFPYGVSITKEGLSRVQQAEDVIAQFGLRQIRVRDHGDTARIEVMSDEMETLLRRDVRDLVVERIRDLGFTYVSLDLQGYRTGSMNEPLEGKN